MIINKQKIYKAGWYLIVFCFMFLWFAWIKPVVAYDGDDWLYLSYVRKAVPIWKDWNPTRVLPEVLMPFCGALAAYVLTPLTGDYIGSITIVSALVLSGFVTVYVRCFQKLMERTFSLSTLCSILLSLLFLLLHFLVLRGNEEYNIYLFHSWDLTCYYYYLIPALLNCSLVMYMMANPGYQEFMKTGSWEKKGIFFMAIYFAIFSNLPASVILAIYAGGKIMMGFIKGLKKKFHLKAFLHNNVVYVLILAAWLLSAVFELCGMRAQYDVMGYRLPLLQGLKETAYRFLLMLKSNNNAFLMFTAVIIVAAAGFVLLSKHKNGMDKTYLLLAAENIVCAVVMLAAVIVLCMKVDISYVYRSEYLFGLYFYGFLILLMSLAYILCRVPQVRIVIPVVVCILTSEINTSGCTFQNSNLQGCDANICVAIDNDLVDQIVSAVEGGQSEMTLYVPVSAGYQNWPHADFVGDRIAATLYEHGIIDQPIRVKTVPDAEMNKKHNLPIPDIAE